MLNLKTKGCVKIRFGAALFYCPCFSKYYVLAVVSARTYLSDYAHLNL